MSQEFNLYSLFLLFFDNLYWNFIKDKSSEWDEKQYTE
jgi:hypothetical protein